MVNITPDNSGGVHFSAHLDNARAQGATHLFDTRSKNPTHAGILSSQSKVPNPLPKPQMVSKTDVMAGEHGHVNPGGEIGSRIY